MFLHVINTLVFQGFRDITTCSPCHRHPTIWLTCSPWTSRGCVGCYLKASSRTSKYLHRGEQKKLHWEVKFLVPLWICLLHYHMLFSRYQAIFSSLSLKTTQFVSPPNPLEEKQYLHQFIAIACHDSWRAGNILIIFAMRGGCFVGRDVMFVRGLESIFVFNTLTLQCPFDTRSHVDSR